MGHESKLPGIKARHAVISDLCRSGKGDEGAIDEALARLRETYLECVAGWAREGRAGVKYHVALTVERPE